MAVATLKFETRESRGKNEARRLRASGRIPAVVYGAEKGKALFIYFSINPESSMADIIGGVRWSRLLNPVR